MMLPVDEPLLLSDALGEPTLGLLLRVLLTVSVFVTVALGEDDGDGTEPDPVAVTEVVTERVEVSECVVVGVPTLTELVNVRSQAMLNDANGVLRLVTPSQNHLPSFAVSAIVSLLMNTSTRHPCFGMYAVLYPNRQEAVEPFTYRHSGVPPGVTADPNGEGKVNENSDTVPSDCWINRYPSAYSAARIVRRMTSRPLLKSKMFPTPGCTTPCGLGVNKFTPAEKRT